MAGKSETVTGIVSGVMNSARVRKPDHENKSQAHQKDGGADRVDVGRFANARLSRRRWNDCSAHVILQTAPPAALLLIGRQVSWLVGQCFRRPSQIERTCREIQW